MAECSAKLTQIKVFCIDGVLSIQLLSCMGIVNSLNAASAHARSELRSRAISMFALREKIRALLRAHPTPFYLILAEDLQRNIKDFKESFAQFLPNSRHFYAVKANHHPYILKQIASQGFGFDVSSGRELGLVEKYGAPLVFSGPGKTDKELEAALRYSHEITLHIDSFGELERIGKLTTRAKRFLNAGVRFSTKLHGMWTKFGVPLEELPAFWKQAKKYKYLRLQGVQSHLSHCYDPNRYASLIQELSSFLRACTPVVRKSLRFIDLGGGFVSHHTQVLHPWKIFESLQNTGGDPRWPHQPVLSNHSSEKTVPVSGYAPVIASAIQKYLTPVINCTYFTEPGRILTATAMHIVTRVIDVKRKNAVIIDAGINMGGWEWGEFFYFPIINISDPALRELRCTIYGPLCTPHDLWGYYCYANRMNAGDVLVVCDQGAYRYSQAQNFIKEIPEVIVLANHAKRFM